MKNLCACHSGKSYTDCCQPLHLGQPVADAERLMRSRYSAYALKLAEYILHTWHPDTRPTSLSVQDLSGIKWLKLEVISSRLIDDIHAEVVFKATYQSGKQKKMHLSEHSQFMRVDGRWLYVGEHPQPASG